MHRLGASLARAVLRPRHVLLPRVIHPIAIVPRVVVPVARAFSSPARPDDVSAFPSLVPVRHESACLLTALACLAVKLIVDIVNSAIGMRDYIHNYEILLTIFIIINKNIFRFILRSESNTAHDLVWRACWRPAD